jgi:hypothetical protein
MSPTTNTTDTLLSEVVEAIPALQPHYADNFWVCSILLCTFILAAIFSDRKYYLSHLLQDFFRPREQAIEGTRTTNIVYMRMGLYFVGLSSIALVLSIYASEPQTTTGESFNSCLVTGGAVLLFYLLRLLLFSATNRIFFDRSTTTVWEQSYANWTILSAIPLYILCVVSVFFNLSSHVILPLLVVGAILLEICLLYRAFHIFSSKRYGILQIFIYLCALELMPLLVAGKALVLFM